MITKKTFEVCNERLKHMFCTAFLFNVTISSKRDCKKINIHFLLYRDACVFEKVWYTNRTKSFIS